MQSAKTLSGAASLLFLGMATVALATEYPVDQHDLRFEPDTLTIKVGDTVVFTDTDRIAHDVTIVNPDGTSEDKGMSNYNEHIAVKFAKTGVYHAKCRIHPDMKMTITVAGP
jgi:plastocyanin